MDVTVDEYTEYMKTKSFNGKVIPRFYFQAAYYFAKKDEGLNPIDPNYSDSNKRKSSSSNEGGDNDDNDDDSGTGNNKRPKTAEGTGTASNNARAQDSTSKNTSEKPKSKKQQLKDEENAMYDVSGVQLTEYADREAAGKVPVYETCASIRRMITANLKACNHRTKTDLVRSLAAQLPPSGPKSLQTAQLMRFQEAKGPRGGAAISCFYAAYVFFEKLRIKQGKPKSKFHQEMEGVWGDTGMELWDPTGKHITLFPGETLRSITKFDKYGA